MNRQPRNQPGTIMPLLLIGVGVLLLAGVVTWLLIQAGAPPAASTPANTSSGEESYPEIKRVSLQDAKTAFDSKTALFVDVRDPDSYASAHIPGSINIPLSQIESRMNELKKDQWIITYCT